MINLIVSIYCINKSLIPQWCKSRWADVFWSLWSEHLSLLNTNLTWISKCIVQCFVHIYNMISHKSHNLMLSWGMLDFSGWSDMLIADLLKNLFSWYHENMRIAADHANFGIYLISFLNYNLKISAQNLTKNGCWAVNKLVQTLPSISLPPKKVFSHLLIETSELAPIKNTKNTQILTHTFQIFWCIIYVKAKIAKLFDYLDS